MSYFDDNFGHWEIEDQDDLDFYRQVQRESVEKRCTGCGRLVRLRPDYSLCNRCCDVLERGGDLEWPDLDDSAEEEV